MDGLQKQLDQLQRHLLQDDITNEAVSKGSAHWHVHHSLKVVQAIIGNLSVNNNEEAQPKRSMLKSWILLTGYIPRGKARAPKKTQTLEEPTPEEKAALHQAAQVLVDGLSSIPSEAHF